MFYRIYVDADPVMTYSPVDAMDAGSYRHLASECQARVFARWLASQNPGSKVLLCYYDDPLPDAMSIEDEIIQAKGGVTAFCPADTQYDTVLNRCYLLLTSDGYVDAFTETEEEAQQWQRQTCATWDAGATYRLGTLRDFGEVEEVPEEG